MPLLTRPTNELLKRLVFLANTRGIIPKPVTATRINKANSQSGAGSATIYTVVGDTELFIDAVSFSSRESVAATAYCVLYVLTAGDVLVYPIFYHLYDIALQQVSSNRFVPALEVLTTQKVVIYADHTNIDASGTIHGWLQDV